jgi:hypothetical protein
MVEVVVELVGVRTSEILRFAQDDNALAGGCGGVGGCVVEMFTSEILRCAQDDNAFWWVVLLVVVLAVVSVDVLTSEIIRLRSG